MILDTDTLSYFLRGNTSVRDKFIQFQTELASTTVNYSELLYGLKKRNNKKYLPKVERIFENIRTYDFNKKAAGIYAELKADLEKQGNPLADMDLMIAAIAIANDETLITNNLKHFSKIEGLHCLTWL